MPKKSLLVDEAVHQMVVSQATTAGKKIYVYIDEVFTAIEEHRVLTFNQALEEKLNGIAKEKGQTMSQVAESLLFDALVYRQSLITRTNEN